MHNPFNIVKDSSLWKNPETQDVVFRRDSSVKIGIVKRVYANPQTNEVRYLTEIVDKNNKILLNCSMLRKWGGIYNYEDAIYRDYKFDDSTGDPGSYATKAGDTVLVVFLNGHSREGIILGGITHPGRKSQLDIKNGPQYQSEFNGILTNINKDGEYTITFRGQPTNLSILSNIPSKTIPEPTYDLNVGTTFLKFDKTGSFEINDNAQKELQNFRIDKPKGTITLNSGKVSVKMTKSGEKIDTKSKELTIISDNTITKKTKRFKMNASEDTKIISPKTAIGNDGIELLELVSQLAQVVIDIATENSIEIHPTGVGPSEVPVNSGQYKSAASKAGVIKGKVDTIKGSL